MDELLYIIYACFVLHNFCELKNERIGEEKVKAVIDYDKHFQPAVAPNNFSTDCNEKEENKINDIILMRLIEIASNGNICIKEEINEICANARAPLCAVLIRSVVRAWGLSSGQGLLLTYYKRERDY